MLACSRDDQATRSAVAALPGIAQRACDAVGDLAGFAAGVPKNLVFVAIERLFLQ